MKGVRVGATALKMLLGMVFIVSAVSKFVTLDAFEIYVYSFGLFGLGLSFYVARLVIGLELVVGAALMSNRHHRFSTVSAISFLLAFVVFLVYAQLIGRTDSCHCFGDLMPFNPVQSILKNAVLVLLLLLVYKYADADWAPRWWLAIVLYVVLAGAATAYMIASYRFVNLLACVLLAVMLGVGLLASFRFYRKWYITALLVAAPLVAVFILSPPDTWYYNDDNEPYNESLFYEQILPVNEKALRAVRQLDSTAELTVGTLADANLLEGRHLVAFLSPNCAFCQLAAQKITTLCSRHDIGKEQILYVFPQIQRPEAYDRFYEVTLSEHFAERRIDKYLFVKITRHSFPLILLVDNGRVCHAYGYRNIDERAIADFMNTTNDKTE